MDIIVDANLIRFVTASLALIATPGQDNIYVLTRGVAQGRRAALVSAWGVCCGLLVHTALAAVGLSALLANSATAFSAVEYAGAAYLIYLGTRMLLSRESLTIPEGTNDTPGSGMRRVFLQGVASNALNLKVALFFLAFLPQFVNPAAGPAPLQFLFFGLLFAALTLFVTTLLGYFSGTLGNWLESRPAVAGATGRFAGGVLVALGVRLAVSDVH